MDTKDKITIKYMTALKGIVRILETLLREIESIKGK